MRKQKEMVESFQMAHRDFMRSLNESLDILDHDISEAQEVDAICTGEWCQAVETSIDELAKYVFSISEPRWVSDSNSKQLRLMRTRLHDMYARYKGLAGRSTH